jgi:hypothetical protein
LRKLLMGAVAVSATLAVAAGAAVAQEDQVTLKPTVKPTDAGTPSHPKNTTMRFQETVNLPGTTVEFIDLTLPRSLKMSGKGLGNCTVDKLAFEGPDACANSKAGPAGTAHAVFGPQNAPLNFVVRPFVQDANSLLFYVESEAGSGLFVQSPITGEITAKGRKLRIKIPVELRQPGGVDASLTGLDQTFSAKKGKKYLVSSIGCKNHKHTFTGTLTFSQRLDGNPVPAPVSSKGSARCTK